MRQNWHELTEMVRLAEKLGVHDLHFNLVEYPHGEEWIKSLDAVTGVDAARSVLGELRKATRLGTELGLRVDTRAIPKLVNMFPSLVETSEEAWMLPHNLLEETGSASRPDLNRRQELSSDDRRRIEELRAAGGPLGESLGPKARFMPDFDADIERRHPEALNFLKDRLSGPLCDFPFTVLYLDTYRTYVCCEAQTKFLYGHRYDSAGPTVFDVWNSQFMQEARAAMYERSFDHVCHTRCPFYRFGGTYMNLDRAARVARGRDLVA
jgi:hypothetical protein